MEYEARIAGLLKADPWRMHVLCAMRDAEIGEAWIAAGFIRNLVWDYLSDISPSPPTDDVDVLVFNIDDLSWDYENFVESKLKAIAPDVPWSVRNQARMHTRNGDQPYENIQHAMWHWLETATSVAVRLDANDELKFLTAYGYEDLFNMILRPTISGISKIALLEERAQTKGWLVRWSRLNFKHEVS